MSVAPFLQWALAQARAAQALGEVPVGAVLVHQDQVIAVGHNRCIMDHDASAHAEVVVLRQAGQALGNYRLQDCDLYVTLEPCAMCAGAMAHARLRRVVYGLKDPRAGAAGSVLNVLQDSGISHQVAASDAQALAEVPASLRRELAQLLPHFFQAKRQAQSALALPLRPDALRTPAAAFANLALPAPSHYSQNLPALAGLRLHYFDSGAPAGLSTYPTYLCLHHGSNWSIAFSDFFAQHANQARVLAPDLIGFGMSDKLKKSSAYSLDWHAQVLCEWMDYWAQEQALDLEAVQLVLQTPAHPLLPALLARAPYLAARAPQIIAPAKNAYCDLPYPDQGHKAALALLKIS